MCRMKTAVMAGELPGVTDADTQWLCRPGGGGFPPGYGCFPSLKQLI